MKTIKNFAPAVVLFVLVVCALEIAVRSSIVPSYLFPSSSEIAQSFFDDGEELWEALLSTGLAAIAGLAASFIFGTLTAALFSISDLVRRAIYPYAIFFQTVPIIAIAPLLVIWFGFGQPTVIASAFIVSVFPVIASTLLGLQSTDPALVDLFRLYSANRFDMLWKLRLPYALPQIFNGLRIAAGLAVIGAVVGEFVAGGGLGAVVDAARTQQRIDKVFAAVLVSSLLGLAIVAIVNVTAFLSLRKWHASAKSR